MNYEDIILSLKEIYESNMNNLKHSQLTEISKLCNQISYNILLIMDKQDKSHHIKHSKPRPVSASNIYGHSRTFYGQPSSLHGQPRSSYEQPKKSIQLPPLPQSVDNRPEQSLDLTRRHSLHSLLNSYKKL
jgi:hypothetical protein